MVWIQPVLTQFHLQQTSLINGSCTCKFVYPDLSFLPLVVFPLLGINDLYSVVYVTVLCSVFAAFLLYRRSKQRYAVLSLMFDFFIFTFISRPGGATKYLAVSVFLLLAYLERKKPYVQGAFLGLAASTHQLAWLALPFFYLLALSELGKKGLFKTVAVSAGVFLVANAYFIALSPQATVSQILYSYAGKLEFQGPSIVAALGGFEHRNQSDIPVF